MSTNKTPHPQLLALKTSLLTTLATLQTHLAINHDTHTRNVKALTATHEELLSQARAASAHADGQQLLHPASTSTPTSVSSLAERILNDPLQRIATLIRNEEYASSRREEDTLAIIQALEWEIEVLEEGEEEEEEEGGEYGMGSDGSGNGIGHPDGQGHEHGHGYGYEEEEDGHVRFHQDIQFPEDLTYVWDGEGYRAMYNFGSVEEEEQEGKGE